MLARAWRKIKITAIDKVLRDLIKRTTGEPYDIYMGTLDGMHDNLIVEALRVGISVEKITHAMFTCEESRDFLRDALDRQVVTLDRRVREEILNVLHQGIPEACSDFTNALLACGDDRLIDVQSAGGNDNLNSGPYGIKFRIVETTLDLSSDYVPVAINSSHIFHKETMNACFQHPNGVYRIEGDTMKWVIVPHDQGVDYFLHKDCAHTLQADEELRREGNDGCCGAQKIVDQLLRLGCDKATAWRLLSATTTVESIKSSKSTIDLRWKYFPSESCLIPAFQIISGFRTELENIVHRAQNIDKRLIGTKHELRQMRIHPDDRFALSKDLYNKAKQKTSSYYPTAQPSWSMEAHPLAPFTTNFLKLDSVETHITLLNELISNAESSDLNQQGPNKQSKKSFFNARTVAVLAALNGHKVDGSLVAKSTQSRGARYFFQNDDDTKSLCTPFSNLILFATTNIDEIKADPVQHLRNEEVSLNDWIALRAALEFDIAKGDFRYGTTEFKRANELISKSLAEFIHDTPRRFSKWLESSNCKVYVSYLTKLSDKMAERTGASSPWLVREMISRIVALGAGIESSFSGPLPLDSYGQMERERKGTIAARLKKKLPVSDRVLHFDCKVNIKGITFRLGECGRVFLHQKRQIAKRPVYDSRQVEVQFQHDREVTVRAPDSQTALTWLARGKCSHLIVTDDVEDFNEVTKDVANIVADDNFV